MLRSVIAGGVVVASLIASVAVAAPRTALNHVAFAGEVVQEVGQLLSLTGQSNTFTYSVTPGTYRLTGTISVTADPGVASITLTDTRNGAASVNSVASGSGTVVTPTGQISWSSSNTSAQSREVSFTYTVRRTSTARVRQTFAGSGVANFSFTRVN
jgi:hypothetical protein